MEASTTANATQTSSEASERVTPSEDASQSTSESAAQGPEHESEERDESGRYLSREAAGYRRRLRDTEAERDDLRAQLERVQRAEVERIAGGAGLAVASDVWIHGASLQTLRGEDGSIDRETVEGLVADIVKDRPGLNAVRVGDVGIGRGGAASGMLNKPKLGLSQLLKPGRG